MHVEPHPLRRQYFKTLVCFQNGPGAQCAYRLPAATPVCNSNYTLSSVPALRCYFQMWQLIPHFGDQLYAS
jgi:hypothetical protein